MFGRRNGLGLIAATLLAFAPSAVHATPFQKVGAVEVGLQLGGLFFLDDAAVPFETDAPAFQQLLDDTFTYTLSGTYNFTRMFGLELALSFAPAEVNRMSYFTTHLDFVVHPITHDWFVPFVGIGPSLALGFPQDGAGAGDDVDPGANLVAGVKLYPWENVGFRVDLRYLVRLATADDSADGSSEVTGHDLALSGGLFVSFGGEGKKEPVLLDTDGDGFLDNVDACPKVPGVETAKGCPDADGDTIVDAKDACPDDAGPLEYDGCPDSDGDTVVDKSDRCPTEPGVVALKGCPDTDADTIANLDDRCPKIPGELKYQGCPPPPPEEVVKKFSGAIQGITFDLNSDVIQPSSFTILDEAARVLKEYPQVEVMIEGHTSAEGSRELNIDLSDRRAKSVKTYLVGKGIGADRLQTKGFGPDNPVAPNDTEANRSLNRRIEFKLLRQ